MTQLNKLDEGDGYIGAGHVRRMHLLEPPRVYCLNQSKARSFGLVNLDETGEIATKVL